jgi:hypothetical protein
LRIAHDRGIDHIVQRIQHRALAQQRANLDEHLDKLVAIERNADLRATDPLIPQGRRFHGYLAVGPSKVIFFEWAEAGGKLNGAYYVLRASAHQVAPELRMLDGQRAGGSVNLSVAGAPAWPGRIHGKTMTVLIPRTQ